MLLLSGWHHYFVVIPLFTALMWSSTLLALLLTWLITGRPKYIPNQIPIAYISDVAASYLKPLFVIACCITGPGLFFSIMIGRVLRHKSRSAQELHVIERVFGRLAVMSAFVAMLFLILLSVFDIGRFLTLHMAFLLLFIVGVSLSAIFTVIEFGWHVRSSAESAQLKRAYVAKVVTGPTLVILAIVFGITVFDAPNVSSVIEWVTGFGFTFYLLTFAYDLWVVRAVKEDEKSKEHMAEMPS